jgi:Putative beta-barrel porin-2, OmpL-like. bbp2
MRNKNKARFKIDRKLGKCHSRCILANYMMRFKKVFLPAILFFSTCTISFAQTTLSNNLVLTAYAEMYYSYDFSKPTSNQKVDWLYNHTRHNEVSLNLAYAKLAYAEKNIRANIATMAGTYAQNNLAAEPTWAQFIYEANAGIKVSKRHNLWLDAGVFSSHIGFESAASADCFTLTRSLIAEASPYYESGAKLGYTSKNEKLYAAILFLNGWQTIARSVGNTKGSFGGQITYKPNQKTTLNYSNFIGSVQPDAAKAIRLYHNFYVQYDSKKKWNYVLGFDYGRDKSGASVYQNIFATSAIAQYKINNKFALAGRAEYYYDPKEVIVTTGTPNGFTTFGASTNLDYNFSDKIRCRVEGKFLKTKDFLFADNKNGNLCLTANMTVKL